MPGCPYYLVSSGGRNSRDEGNQGTHRLVLAIPYRRTHNIRHRLVCPLLSAKFTHEDEEHPVPQSMVHRAPGGDHDQRTIPRDC